MSGEERGVEDEAGVVNDERDLVPEAGGSGVQSSSRPHLQQTGTYVGKIEKSKCTYQCCGFMTFHFGTYPDPRIHASD